MELGAFNKQKLHYFAIRSRRENHPFDGSEPGLGGECVKALFGRADRGARPEAAIDQHVLR